MTAHLWKAVVAAALLQVVLSPARAAPQGISVYSSTDEKGEQHTSVMPLNQQQSAQLAAQNLAQINQQQSAISSLIGNLFGGNLFSSLAGAGAHHPVVAPVPAPAAHKPAVHKPAAHKTVLTPPPPAPAALSAHGAHGTPCAGCGVA